MREIARLRFVDSLGNVVFLILSLCSVFPQYNRFYFARRLEQEMTEESPGLVCELRALRQRKEELETHLATLQDSRKHLMLQLETLMKLLKVTLIILPNLHIYFFILPSSSFCDYPGLMSYELIIHFLKSFCL